MASTSQKQPAADLQTELQQLKFNMEKMKEEEDMHIIEIRNRRKKVILMKKKTAYFKEFVRPLKIKNKNLKKDREERKEIQKKLQVELEILSVNNKKNLKRSTTE